MRGAPIVLLFCCWFAPANAEVPMYKPSSRWPVPLDITSNDYGRSASAPEALEIGDVAPDFTVEGPDGSIALADLRARGPVALIFYRGHW